jgi:AraC family transcriptional regulator
MTNILIEPERIHEWIPGKITLDSKRCAWDGMTLRGYHYPHLKVDIPAMRDYMFVVYKNSTSKMSRRRNGPWQDYRVEPGVISILTRAEESQWKWDRPIDVSHLYLSHSSIANVAAEVFERDIVDIELQDCVRAEDKVLPMLVRMLEAELLSQEIGGPLYVDAIKNQACVHVLRHYSNITFNEVSHGGFSSTQKRLLSEFIEESINSNISMTELANLMQLSVFHFNRKFTKQFGISPHTFVTKKRVDLATKLLSTTSLPIKAISAQCGFSDQSHMTRLLRRFIGLTPAAFRQQKNRNLVL